LEKFGYKAVFIGFSFAIPTLIYASTSPLIYLLTSKIRKPGVICIGYMILFVAVLLVGPSKVLGLYNSPAFIILGLAIMGFGCGTIIIPIMPEMIESIEEKHPEIDDGELNNNISGLFIAF
jgi:cyanate permease